MSDRTVHASYPDMEIVRYDRSGKWYLEPKIPGLPRQHVTVKEAADAARWGLANGGGFDPGLPGGNMFDRLVTRELEDDLAALRVSPVAPTDAAFKYAVTILRHNAEEFIKTGNTETAAMLDAAARYLIGAPAAPTETLREAARRAKNLAAAPDYDEEAIRDALWHVVNLALAAARGETRLPGNELCADGHGSTCDEESCQPGCPMIVCVCGGPSVHTSVDGNGGHAVGCPARGETREEPMT